MALTQFLTKTRGSEVTTMYDDIDLSEEFGEPEASVLPLLEAAFGADTLPADLDLNRLINVALDPATPAPEGDLIPEPAPEFEQPEPEVSLDPEDAPQIADDLGAPAEDYSDPNSQAEDFIDLGDQDPEVEL